MFSKNCHTCKDPFEHQSRNAKYCGEKCLEKARGKHHSRGKRKREYKKDVTNRRAQSMSRKQAREFCIASHALSVCVRCGNAHPVSELEDHHRDGDPFNNDKDNLSLLDKGCHSKSDNEWRKAKAEGKPIEDVRHYKQVGAVVQDRDGVLWVVVGKQKYLSLASITPDVSA